MNREETSRKEMLQKKLIQKKYLTEDFNKWLAMRETEHRKNEIPRAYVSFEHSTIIILQLCH